MKKNLVYLLIAAIVLLAGCARPSDEELAETEAFESALQTAIVETIAASLPEEADTPEAPSPNEDDAEEGSQQASPTVPSLPTSTLTPETAPTDQATTTPQIPCYRAELIEETIPDGTKFTPGKYFTKIWIIRNTGVCAWNTDFRWVLVEGEDFNAATDLTLDRVVNPNEDLRVMMELKTPQLEGLYKGTYKILTDEGGEVTPIGFWVTVISEKAE